MQFGAEVAHPTPEGTSNGLFQLSGQISVIFVFIMEALKTRSGSFTPGLLMAIALILVCLFVISRLEDPVRHQPAV
jgi:MFS-type transporter involved in bile tolerance (Atg22 family)